mmetsp:Transcript_17009/g.22119  ORF Transcript_17009/g.22119 Transcript_17009/m.22119 type:complete len:903 (-) Transcript_17009:46-2754(-)
MVWRHHLSWMEKLCWAIIFALKLTGSFSKDFSCLNSTLNYNESMFDGSIILGMAVPLSGWLSNFDFLSTIIHRKIYALHMYQRYVNYCLGGLQVGDKLMNIELVILNDDSNATLTVDRTRNLVENYGVNFLFPSFSPALEVAALDYAEEQQVITMMETGVSYSCPGRGYCFSVRSPDHDMMGSIFRALALDGAKTIAYFYQKTDPGMAEHCKGIPDMIQELPANLNGVKVVYVNDSTTDTSVSTFRHLIQDMQDNLNGEEIDILIGCIGVCHRFINQTKVLGLDAKAMVFPRCVDENKLETLGPDGRYILGPSQWDEQMSYTCELTGWSAREFGDAYRWLFGSDPAVTGAGTFAGALSLGQAAVNAGSLDSQVVRYALSRLDIDTMYGRIIFNEDNMGSNDMAFQQMDENLEIQIVIPDAIATAPLVYPMPVWSYRACIEEHGEGSCLCNEEGCAECTLSDYDFTISSCNLKTATRELDYFKLNATDCLGGVPLPEHHHLDCDFLPMQSGIGRTVTVLSGFAAAMAFCYFLWVLVNKREKMIRYSQPVFCLLFTLFGCIFPLSTLLFLGPPTRRSCVLRLWVFHLSFTGMAGSLFVKVFRVWRIFNQKKMTKRVVVKAKTMLQALSLMLLVDVVILLGLTLFDTPRPYTSSYEIVHVGEIPFTKCSSAPTFSSALVSYKVATLVIGCYFSFQTRNVSSDFSETKFIMFAMYSIALVLGITMLVSSQDVSLKVSLLLQGFGVSFASMISLSCVLFPKILSLHFPHLMKRPKGTRILAVPKGSSSSNKSNSNTSMTGIKGKVNTVDSGISPAQPTPKSFEGKAIMMSSQLSPSKSKYIHQASACSSPGNAIGNSIISGTEPYRFFDELKQENELLRQELDKMRAAIHKDDEKKKKKGSMKKKNF